MSLCSCRPEVSATRAFEHFGALFYVLAFVSQGINPRLDKECGIRMKRGVTLGDESNRIEVVVLIVPKVGKSMLFNCSLWSLEARLSRE